MTGLRDIQRSPSNETPSPDDPPCMPLPEVVQVPDPSVSPMPTVRLLLGDDSSISPFDHNSGERDEKGLVLTETSTSTNDNSSHPNRRPIIRPWIELLSDSDEQPPLLSRRVSRVVVRSSPRSASSTHSRRLRRSRTSANSKTEPEQRRRRQHRETSLTTTSSDDNYELQRLSMSVLPRRKPRSSSSNGRHRLMVRRSPEEVAWQRMCKLIQAKGLLWLLMLVGTASIAMTVVTNRTIWRQNELATLVTIQYPTKLALDASPAAGLRGQLIRKGLDEKRNLPSHREIMMMPARYIVGSSQRRMNRSKIQSATADSSTVEVLTVKDSIRGLLDQPLTPIVMPVKHSVQPPFELQDRNLYSRPGSTTQHTQKPRAVVLHDSIYQLSHRPRKVQLYPPDFTDNTQLYGILDSSDERVRTMELRKPLVQGECVPMQEWQTTFHPSCNSMHEVDLSHGGTETNLVLFGTKGYWRNAWRVDVLGNFNHEIDSIVLKTLKIGHSFEEAYYENNRIDAIAMERLTSSPHVINIFGFCGQSVLTEYADGKRLGELADKSKAEPLARLRIARDVAQGLADLHSIDGENNATLVHLDVNPANVVSVGGTLKLNDLNVAMLRRWNTTSNHPCGFSVQYPNPQWRSPEEAREESNLTEKVDVFSLGHILFRLICGHEPWNKLEPGGKLSKLEVNEKVKKGVLPTIPRHVLHSKNPEVIAIRQAMLRCYTFDPAVRPSARWIATYLQTALDHLRSRRSH